MEISNIVHRVMSLLRRTKSLSMVSRQWYHIEKIHQNNIGFLKDTPNDIVVAVCRRYRHLEFLDFTNIANINQRAWKTIASMQYLKKLRCLSRCAPVTPCITTHIRKINSLKHLTIKGCTFRRTPLHNIFEMSGLETLQIFNIDGYDPDEFNGISKLINLQHLSIIYCKQYPGKAFLEIMNMKWLKSLDITRTNRFWFLLQKKIKDIFKNTMIYYSP